MRDIFLPEQPRLPVYINNRNRLTMTKKLVEWLEKIPYAVPVVIDNDSGYKPLIDWYGFAYQNLLVFLSQNMGPYSFFKPYDIRIRYGRDLYSSIYRSLFDLAPEWFVYTDPDLLPIEECPLEAIEVFHRLMIEYPDKQKVGFGLKIDDIPDHYPAKAEVIAWEKSLVSKEIRGKTAVEANIDTTFALYKKSRWSKMDPVGRCLRTTYPYLCRHLPWYVDPNNLDEEEKFYMANASEAATWSNRIAEIAKEKENAAK